MIAVAIDGPSGAGKSTIARAVANDLGYVYVDTGACYRGVAYYALSNGVDPQETEKLINLLPNLKIQLVHNDLGEQRLLINGVDSSEEIRTPEVSEGASVVSAVPQVREWLLDTQRDFAKTQNVVMDGRDIGTVVLPNAQVKIFLTATAEERANRRYKEYLQKDAKIDYNDVLEDINKRDNRDMNRDTAPLKQSEDAVLVDTTNLNFQETLQTIVDIIKDRI